MKFRIIRKPRFKNYTDSYRYKIRRKCLAGKYINLNTNLRIEAKQSGNNFEVDFFKLMNNSVFVKTLENIRNMVDIRLISSDKVA